LGRQGVRELGSWGVGELGSWGVGELGTLESSDVETGWRDESGVNAG